APQPARSTALPDRSSPPPTGTAVDTYVAYERAPHSALPAPRPSRGGRNCIMTHENPARLSPGAALTLGWCLMEIDRPLEAVAAFDQAFKNGSSRTREEAAYGKSLAYL